MARATTPPDCTHVRAVLMTTPQKRSLTNTATQLLSCVTMVRGVQRSVKIVKTLVAMKTHSTISTIQSHMILCADLMTRRIVNCLLTVLIHITQCWLILADIH